MPGDVEKAESIATARADFLSAIDELMLIIGESLPGRELQGLWPFHERLATAACQLGYKHPPIQFVNECIIATREHLESVELFSPYNSWMRNRVLRVYRTVRINERVTEWVDWIELPLEPNERHELLSGLRQWRRAVDAIKLSADPSPKSNQDAEAEPGAEPQRGKSRKGTRDRRAQWLAEAMLLVCDHPEWSDREIAKKVGRDPSTLSRSPEYKAAAAMARGAKSDLPKGQVTKSSTTGLADVEVTAPRPGEPIPGSRYFRGACPECGGETRVEAPELAHMIPCEGCR